MSNNQKPKIERTPEQAKFRLKALGQNSITSRSGIPSNRNISKRYRPARLLKDGKVDPLENMIQRVPRAEIKNEKGEVIKPADDGRMVTNGSFGVVSSFQGAGATAGVHKKWTKIKKNGKKEYAEIEITPDHITFEHTKNERRAERIVHRSKSTAGRNRNAPKRKNSSIAVPTVYEISRLKLDFLKTVREKMTTALLKQKLTGYTILTEEEIFRLGVINDKLRVTLSREDLLTMYKRDVERERSLAGQKKAGNLSAKDVIKLDLRREIDAIWIQIQSEKPEPVHPKSVIKDNVKLVSLGDEIKAQKEVDRFKDENKSVTAIVMNNNQVVENHQDSFIAKLYGKRQDNKTQ